MWYEVLPTVLIIGGAMHSLCITFPLFMKAIYGHPYGKELTSIWNRSMHERDIRIVGNPFKTMGLRNVPDD